MANNIKIVGNILNTTQVSRYSEEDLRLISSQRIQEDFGGTNDYIEYYVYDVADNLLNTNYNYLKYKLPSSTGLKPGTTTTPNTTGNIQTENIGVDSTLATPTSSLYPIIEIDPVQDLQDLGYSSGEFKVRYNLFQTKLSNYIDSALFVKEISQDRTEIRLASTTLTNDEIESVTLSLIDEINASPYYVSYLLNFGDNKQYITVNTALNKAPEGYEVLFKLYEPLPLEVQEKQTLWIVEEKVEPYIFDINLDKLILPPPPPTLRSPNFDIPVSENQGTVSSTYQTYNALINNVQTLQQNSYHQILNLLATQSIQINVDYTDYNNFIFFGSAYQRLSNFRDKISDIEFYTNFINASSSLATTTPNLLSELNRYSASISDIISKFDGYERYLYFESSSYAWPKTTSNKPFILYSVTSSQALTWYNNATGSAKEYDSTNYNNLEYAVPVYLRDDENNQPFLTFLNMVGHYFDNVWIYLKAVTDINLANNSLTEGISKDLVYERLKSLGLKLYNSQAGEDVNQFLIGANTGSSVWDSNTTVTGSYLNNIPRKDLVAELYKRIYHNLPLLLKQKGTVAGLDTLMTIFGIPNQTYYTIGSSSFYTPTGSAATASILNVKEYGGGLKTSLIQGYNNDKVRIVQNTITGSVLSPILSLQTFPTDANEFRENDSHYIDISFSPQNQIDNYISGAIASNNPTWSLDDYIGDPRQQYSTTYTDLDAQRKLYFENGTGTSLPFTASLLDYNGFIRLVEYFDNSLFKMLEDFVPERASLSTGVTINSPVLERNKAVYANPTATTTQSVHEGEIPTTSISTQYGTFYNALSSSNNTMGWFDGELSGSVVDVHQYFEDNYNPYLQYKVYSTVTTTTGNWYSNSFPNWFVLVSPSQATIDFFINAKNNQDSILVKQISGDDIGLNNGIIFTPIECVASFSNYFIYISPNKITEFLVGLTSPTVQFFRITDNNTFQHSDWNTLLNNVSENVQSNIRQKIEYIGEDFRPTSSILVPAELQDSYLSLRSYNTSRYEGAKVTSKLYNTYTATSSLQSFTVLTSNYANPTSASFTIWASTSSLAAIQNLDEAAESIASAIRKQYSVKLTYVTGSSIGINNGITFIPLSIEQTFGNPATKEYRVTSSPKTFTPVSVVVDPTVTLSYTDIYQDMSYGKTAAIDRQSYKVGWVKNIPSQSLNFIDKTQIQLKYLVDKDTNITDLTLKNNNLFEIQNTFKSGDTVVLSLSDAIKPSFQKNLDGTKTIFKGGYSYDPILFRELNENLYFRLNGDVATSIGFVGFKTISTDFVSYANRQKALSEMNNGYPTSDPVTYASGNPGYYWFINYNSNPRDGSTPRGLPAPTVPMASSVTYNVSSYNNSFPSYASTSSLSFPGTSWGIDTFGASQGGFNLFKADGGKLYIFDLTSNDSPTKLNFNTSSLNTFTGFVNGSTTSDNSYFTDNGNYLFKAPYESDWTISGNIPFFFRLSHADIAIYSSTQRTKHPFQVYGINFKIVAVLEKSNNPTDPSSWQYVASTRLKGGYNDGLIDSFSSTTNTIKTKSGIGTGYYNLYDSNNNLKKTYFNLVLQNDDPQAPNPNEIVVHLQTGEVLRWRLFFFDPDNFFAWGRDLLFDIGLPNEYSSPSNAVYPTFPWFSLNEITSLGTPYPTFTIQDKQNPITSYSNIAEHSSTLFTSLGDNALLFKSESQYLINNSIFLPESSSQGTNNKYSGIIDQLNIQPDDLIRIGSISDPSPTYFTVTSVNNNYSALTSGSAFFGSSIQINPGTIDTAFNLGADVVFDSSYALTSTVTVIRNNRPFTITTDYGIRSVICFPTSFKTVGSGGSIVVTPNPLVDSFQLVYNGTKQFTISNITNYFPSLSPSTVFNIRNIVNATISLSAYDISTGTFTYYGNESHEMTFIVISDNIATGGSPTLPSDYPQPSFFPQTGMDRWISLKTRSRRSPTTYTGYYTNPVIFISPYYNADNITINESSVPKFVPNILTPPTTRIVLDQPVSTNINVPLSQVSNNFAILRPKLDETSVIINFSKRPGDVSQTILIPQDANDEIKNNVGTIFQKLNVDLSNQNITQ